jgi:hypothetical protein
MSESTNTLAGLIALNDRNLSTIEASDILNESPVLAKMYAQRASTGGTTHKFERKLTAEGNGFRLINEGITNTAGTFEIVSQECAVLDATVKRDIAQCNGFKGGPSALLDTLANSSVGNALFTMECAMFRANINKQFTGLPGSPFFDQITADSQVVNGGGNGGRSVWLIRSAMDGISVVMGFDGMLKVDPDQIAITRDASNREYSVWMRSIVGAACLQVGSKYDAARIANLDGTTGHTLTDTLIAEALIKFKAGKMPNMIALSRKSWLELQASRTAVNPTGAPAPLPSEAFGIPIVVTDAIPENEAALNTTTTTTTTTAQA